eukprot:2801235-Amphidinium_carterae.1
MQRLPKTEQQPTNIREDEDYETYDYVSETTHTRTSGSTSLKRKSDMDEKDAKKMTTYPPGAHIENKK